MLLKGDHKDWKLDQISIIDVRAVELEQLLTFLWLRVKHENRPIAKMTGPQIVTVPDLAALMEASEESFEGFRDAPGAAEAWLRADLVYTRKRRPESFTVGRPVHLAAARVRNPKENNDSFASAHVYSWIHNVDPDLFIELREFLEPTESEVLDLPSLALKLLGNEQPQDQVRPSPDKIMAPLCWRQAVTYAEDVRAILAYRHVIPRASVVDHLRRLTGLHVGLHLMRMFRLIAKVEASGGTWACPACATRGAGPCAAPLEVVVDCGEDANSPVAKYAEASWTREDEWLARYVRSHLALKKLHQFAEYEAPRGRVYPHDSLAEIAALETTAPDASLDRYFEGRINSLRESVEDATVQAAIAELTSGHRRMGMSEFRSYHALLCHFSEKRWISFNRWLLDSFLGKNSPDGLLRQPIGGRRLRRAVLTPGLLETLVLAAAVRIEGGRARTASMRVDQLVERLRFRYGLLISDAPDRDSDDPAAIRILADNGARFRGRLRETGLFIDQSDAYLAQIVRPRIRL